jgi:hypothetical protein
VAKLKNKGSRSCIHPLLSGPNRAWYLALRKSEPIRAALVKAAADCAYKIGMSAEEGNSEGAFSAGAELARLVSYISPNKRLDADQAQGILGEYDKLMGEASIPTATKMAFLNGMKRAAETRRRGRPAERRSLAVSGLEMKHAGAKLTEVTAKLCPCTKKEHDLYCEQTMRQSVMTLQRLLRRNGWKV